MLVVDENNKKSELMKLLRSKGKNQNDKILIFVTTKRNCDYIAQMLDKEDFKALSIHGDKSQAERDYALEKFKSSSNVLVATDVASRGLDIKNIKFVINYDFPMSIEDYIHRIGRTGRAGATGESFTFFTSRDCNHAGDLVEVLKKADQKVPDDLVSFGDSRGRSRAKFGRWEDEGDPWKFKEQNGEGFGAPRGEESGAPRGEGFGAPRGGGRGGFRGGRGDSRGGFGGGGREERSDNSRSRPYCNLGNGFDNNNDDRTNGRSGSDWSAPKSNGGAWGSSEAPQKSSNSGAWGSNDASEKPAKTAGSWGS